MNDKLNKLLKEYIMIVNQVCELMLEDLGVSSKEQLREVRGAYVAGKLKSKSGRKYLFHGRGCRYSDENVKIDWEFGYDKLWCGLDPWKFIDYLKDNNKKEYSQYNDGKQIQNIFNEMIIQKKMVKKQGLYYFVEDLK